MPINSYRTAIAAELCVYPHSEQPHPTPSNTACMPFPSLHAAQAQLPSSPSLSPDPSVADLTQFPFCACDDYKCASSPWRLTYAGTSPNGYNVNVCFNLQWVSGVGGGDNLHHSC